jgi:enamine deaminase RidA (YjgF/YER057c/UK114 family)
MDTEGALVGEGDLERQTRKVMENLSTVLAASGTDLAHVLKTTVYMTDISQRKIADAVRRDHFGDHRPASTILEVPALTLEGIEIEIEAVAAIPGP